MMHLKEICRIVRGVLRTPEDKFLIPAPMKPVVVNGVSTDTRTLKKGDIFFALVGPNFDGHDHVEEAFRKGAVAAVVKKSVSATGPVIVVENVLTALGNLASVYRMMLGSRVIAVTGSNGKTTTKEMIAHVLGRERKVVRAPASWNNFIGVPLTLFGATPETDYIVIEVGTNHPGEVARLGGIARPDAAVITSVSESHLAGLGNLDGVAKEKASLLTTVRGSGFGIIPTNALAMRRHVKLSRDKLILVGAGRDSDLWAEDVEHGIDGLKFRVRGVNFRMGLLGGWNVSNALSAAAVCMSFGVELDEVARRLEDFRGPKMRMEPLELCGFHILNDAYNSNPASAHSAIEEFSEMPAPGRRVVVFGDMLELGDRSAYWHGEVGKLLEGSDGIDLVVGIGGETLHMLDFVEGLHFPTVHEAAASVRNFLRPGDTILLKGSRGVALENLIKGINDNFKNTEKVSA